jgi:hypothetical protein
MSKSFKLQWIAAAALVMTQSLVHAADPANAISVSSALTGVTFKLIDLTPNDGQTPWIQINDGSAGNSWGGYAPGFEWSGLFPASTLSNQWAEATTNSLTARVQATDDDLKRDALPSAQDPTQSSVDYFSRVLTGNVTSAGRGRSIYDLDQDPLTGRTVITAHPAWIFPQYDFTVSANTRVVVEGIFAYQVNVNGQALSPGLQGALSNGSAQLTASANAEAQLSWSYPFVDLDQTSWATMDEAQAAIDAANPHDIVSSQAGLTDGSGSRPMSLTLDNDTSGALQGGFAMIVDAHATLTAPTAALAVPEPGTYALMGLGLVGIGLATRRRRNLTAMKTLNPLRCAVWGALAMAQMTAHAATSSELFSGSATMGGLTYQLIDLTPDDGQSPWIQFTSGSNVGGRGYLLPDGHLDGRNASPGSLGTYPTGNEMSYGGQFPASPVGIQSGDGLATASATSSSLTVGVHANANDWGSYRYQDNSSRIRMDVNSQANTGSDLATANWAPQVSRDPVTGKLVITTRLPSEEPSYNYTVSANTRLVVSGTWSFQSSLNAQNLAALPGSATAQVSAFTYMTASWTHALVDLNGTSWDSWAELDAAVAAANPVGGANASAFLPNGGLIDQTLSVTLDNTSATAQQGYLYLNEGIFGSVYGVQPGAVPEPGTYALMGLGLLAMSLVRRRPIH